MKLAWRRVELPLVRPLTVGGEALAERAVLELRLTDPYGATFFGEAAPLPGLHAESLADLLEWLPWARERLAERFVADRLRVEALAADETWQTMPPSLRCGLEAAVLLPGHAQIRTGQLFGLLVCEPPATSALFDGDLGDLGPDLARHRCLKVKVGRRDPHTEIAVIHAIRRVLGDGAELRLDANRAFTLDEAVRFAAELRDVRPAWIEEPLRDPEQMLDFIACTGLPVALDETLHEPGHAALAEAEGVAAWVLKPALLGVTGTVQAFHRALAAPGQPRCVVSSSFEGPRGLAVLQTLARIAPGLPAPGLGTAEWFGPPRAGEWMDVHDAE